MSETRHDEKDEKEEKRHEKEEKGRNDPLSTIIWGMIIIWAGLVFLAESMGLLAGLKTGDWFPGMRFVGRMEAWSLIFLGAGLIVLLEAAIRYAMPSYRRAIAGTVILGFVFIGIGLGNWIGWNMVGPLILIGIGAAILFGGFLRRS